MQVIELYHRQMCAQSAKVRRYIETNNLKSKIKSHDTDSQDWARQQLTNLMGNATVPVLLVDGEPIQPTELILAWLQANLVDKVVV